MKKIVKELKKEIKKDFGERCEDYCDGCVVCRIWHAYDVIEDSYDDYDMLNEHEKTIKKPKFI